MYLFAPFVRGPKAGWTSSGLLPPYSTDPGWTRSVFAASGGGVVVQSASSSAHPTGVASARVVLLAAHPQTGSAEASWEGAATLVWIWSRRVKKMLIGHACCVWNPFIEVHHHEGVFARRTHGAHSAAWRSIFFRAPEASYP